MIYQHNPIIFDDREFKPVTGIHLYNVEENRYICSNYAEVYDLKLNRYVSISNFCNPKLYCSVSLRTNSGLFKSVLLHRLVAMLFIPGDWSLQVNHKDGHKNNCYYYNLEWVTPLENLVHAIQTGLQPIGEDKSNSKLSNDQVHLICKLLEQRVPISSIVNKIGLDNTKRNRSLIVDIKRGRCWNHISNNYNISKDELRDRTLSRECVYKICSIFERDPSIKYTEVLQLIESDIDKNLDRRKLLNIIGSIKLRRAYTDISKNFNW